MTTHLRCLEVKKSLFPISNVSLSHTLCLSLNSLTPLHWPLFHLFSFFIHFATFFCFNLILPSFSSPSFSSSPSSSFSPSLSPLHWYHHTHHTHSSTNNHLHRLILSRFFILNLSPSISLPPSPTPPSGSFPPIFLFLTQTVGLPDLAWTCPCLCPLPLPNSVVHRSLYLWSGYPFSHIRHSSLTQSAMIPGC